MISYCCRVIDGDDHILATRRFEAANDGTAVRIARAIFAAARGHGYEAWQGDHLIYRELLDPLHSGVEVGLARWRQDCQPLESLPSV